MNRTQNYSLNQWEADDRVLRTDFNADNAKIDAAIAAAAGKAAEAHVYVGSFVGDGVDGHTIQLPWAPKFVLLLGKFFDDPVIGFLTQGDFSYIESRIIFPQDNNYEPILIGDKLTLQNGKCYNGKDQTTQYIMFR